MLCRLEGNPKPSQVGKGPSAECCTEFCWLAVVASIRLCSLRTPFLNPLFTTVDGRKKKKIRFQMASYRFTFFSCVFQKATVDFSLGENSDGVFLPLI